VESVPSDVNAN
jgi:DNA repair exonuclease SbcCD ATPase subunit